MTEQDLLKKKLDDAILYARKNKNRIPDNEFQNIFQEYISDARNLELIAAFLKEKNIVISSENENNEESYDIPLDDEDKKAIDFYFEELKELPYLTDKEKHRLLKKSIEGDDTSRELLLNSFLPQVVEIARLYTGQGIQMEDLIGEGNIALLMGIQMLDCIDNEMDIEGHIGKIVIDALEALVNEEQDVENLIIKLGKQLKSEKRTSSELEEETVEDRILGDDELLKEAFRVLDEEEDEK